MCVFHVDCRFQKSTCIYCREPSIFGQPLWIDEHQRAAIDIRISAWPIGHFESVGPEVSGDRGIEVAMPVLVEAGFELNHWPGSDSRGWRGPIGHHVIEGRRGAGIGNRGHGASIDPDVFGEQRAGVVVFGNGVAVEIVDAVQRHGIGGALNEARQVVENISVGSGTVDIGRGQLPGGVVGVVFCRGRRDEIVVRDVTAGVRLEGA